MYTYCKSLHTLLSFLLSAVKYILKNSREVESIIFTQIFTIYVAVSSFLCSNFLSAIISQLSKELPVAILFEQVVGYKFSSSKDIFAGYKIMC